MLRLLRPRRSCCLLHVVLVVPELRRPLRARAVPPPLSVGAAPVLMACVVRARVTARAWRARREDLARQPASVVPSPQTPTRTRSAPPTAVVPTRVVVLVHVGSSPLEPSVARALASATRPGGVQRHGTAARPTDAMRSSATKCRDSTGACDATEFCSGTAASCPADAMSPAGTECRASAGACDVAEVCSGSTSTCPVDAFAATTVECRASSAPVTSRSHAVERTLRAPRMGSPRRPSSAASRPEPVTSPSGVQAPAPPVPSTVSPQPPSSVALPPASATSAESCTGTAALCPADAVAPPTTTCRASAGACDPGLDLCDGTSVDCRGDAFGATRSRSVAPPLARATFRLCMGTSPTCPSDVLVSLNSSCRQLAGPCDERSVRRRERGVSCRCAATGQRRRPQTDSRDRQAEACTGTSAACPAEHRQAAQHRLPALGEHL